MATIPLTSEQLVGLFSILGILSFFVGLIIGWILWSKPTPNKTSPVITHEANDGSDFDQRARQWVAQDQPIVVRPIKGN